VKWYETDTGRTSESYQVPDEVLFISPVPAMVSTFKCRDDPYTDLLWQSVFNGI